MNEKDNIKELNDVAVSAILQEQASMLIQCKAKREISRKQECIADDRKTLVKGNSRASERA